MTTHRQFKSRPTYTRSILTRTWARERITQKLVGISSRQVLVKSSMNHLAHRAQFVRFNETINTSGKSILLIDYFSAVSVGFFSSLSFSSVADAVVPVNFRTRQFFSSIFIPMLFFSIFLLLMCTQNMCKRSLHRTIWFLSFVSSSCWKKTWKCVCVCGEGENGAAAIVISSLKIDSLSIGIML